MSKEVKILIFNIDDEYYATDIKEVERIIGYEEPTKLPDAPAFVKGVINHEGRILPIISLADRFKLNTAIAQDDLKIIVVKEDDGRIGIIVDSVSEVRDIKESSIELPTDTVSGISQRYIKGLINLDDKIVIFLNLSSILTDEEKEAIG